MDDHCLTHLETDAPCADTTPPQNPPESPTEVSTSTREAEPKKLLDLDRPVWQLVLILAWPVFIQKMLVVAVTLSDRLLAGRFQPSDPSQHVATQAAQTTASYFIWFILSYTTLVTVGGTALVARFVGAGNRTLAMRVTNQAIFLAICLGLLGSVAGLLCLPGLTKLLQLEGETAQFAINYLQPLFLLLVFQMVETAGIACLVGAGDTRTGLWVLGGVTLFNFPFSWGFFHGWGPLPRLEFVGIAWGTAVCHLLGSLVVMAVLIHGRAGMRLRLGLMIPDLGLIRRLLRISVPAAADSMSLSVGQLAFVSIVNRLGDADRAAHGIALTWEGLAYMSGVAIGTAAMALVGQFLGAGRPDRAARSGWTAFLMAGVWMSLEGALFFALAPVMFRLFCPWPGQEPIIEAGVPVLRLVAFGMPMLASCQIFTFALRGAGDTRIPVLFTWIGFLLVRIPLAYVLVLDQLDLGWLGTYPGANLGLFGAWLAMCTDLLIRGLFFLARFASGRWQKIEV